MQQAAALTERIRTLKGIAESMHEGAIHTQLFPEVDKILALPEHLDGASVGEREAVARQVREYEQVFDSLGYTLLEQIMPPTGVSQVFQLVRAADAFKADLRGRLGEPVTVAGETRPLDEADFRALTRHSLSIGTPPATDATREAVARILFGTSTERLQDFVETLDCDPEDARRFLDLCDALVEGSLHYATPAEERAFLRRAARFVNFEGGQLFNRVVVTESPERVIQLIRRHVFDKFGPHGERPLEIVDRLDPVDDALLERMRLEPNRVFVARVTRIPHRLIRQTSEWRGVLGRLLLVDASARARRSNTTLVYTLFPHVARTLRNVQTALAGRPANTQLVLRRLLEGFTPETLGALGDAIDRRLSVLEGEGAFAPSEDVDALRTEPWRRDALADALALGKLRRLVRFFERVAGGDDADRAALGDGLRREVTDAWMRTFYGDLPRDAWRATVVPGGGRGALTLVGDFFRREVARRVDAFRTQALAESRQRLEAIKDALSIPATSTDEIQAAVRQSQLRARAPGQWPAEERRLRRTDYLSRTFAWRAADAAGKVARSARRTVDRAAFGNLTGGAASLVKRTMDRAGFGALHGRLEEVLSEPFGRADRRLRHALAPMQEAVRSVQRAMDEVKGELDPMAVGEIERLLNLVEQRDFQPMLVLPEMSWSYGDVFPDKDYPAAEILRIPLNARHEIDPGALLARLEELRYRLRRFPELFELTCRSMLLVVNSPHNPTGVVYRRETLLRLLQIASEYGLTVVDDNSYHKLVTREVKAREGDASLAQLYQRYREQFSRPVRIVAAAATTKGLQGAGDRTGLLFSEDAEVVAFAEREAPDPHLVSLYLTRAKLETGRAAKQATRALERLAGQLLDPTSRTRHPLHAVLREQLAHAADPAFPVPVFDAQLEGYERLLRLESRAAGRRHLSEAVSGLVSEVKGLRLEKALRRDVERRFAAAREAHARAYPGVPSPPKALPPQGAFYYALQLCEPDDDRGVRPFLLALCRHRKVDAVYAGRGFVRLSLGGALPGSDAGYRALGTWLEVSMRLLHRYWEAFDAAGRDPAALDDLFGRGDVGRRRQLEDLAPLLEAGRPLAAARSGLPVELAERGLVYAIEEGRSTTDKVFIELGREAAGDGGACETVDGLLDSRAFRVLYRRLLKRVYGSIPELEGLDYEQVENQYGPLACRSAYLDRQLIDAPFRALMVALYGAWHGESTVKVLSAHLHAARHPEKVAALHGLNEGINELLEELMHAFEAPDEVTGAASSFEVGFERLEGIGAAPELPAWLRRIIGRCAFAGATTALDPAPRFVTGAAKRVADHRYQFNRRDGGEGDGASDRGPALPWFRSRLEAFASVTDFDHYVAKAVQVGPFKMLLVIHKSDFHLISDELRLFPQIAEVQLAEALDGLRWDAVLILGLPGRAMGESFKTGYVHEHTADGALLPVAWVAREDATDYVGFLKKSLLTLHNERVKAMGGLPIHGAMITITFKNGLRKTLVFSADSGTGKSETIAAMMEQLAAGTGQAAELKRVEILAGDMLSLWRGEDGQLYAFGTETGDFMRLTDISETWQARFGDLLKRGSYSNLDHPKNPRVTIPGICDAHQVLSPTRVNGFFYIDNYSAPAGRAVELSDDPRHVLQQVLVRGLRKNKGTSGDQPSLRAGLEFAGESALVTRFRHRLDAVLAWEPRTVDGEERTCLVYRDGADDVFAAREIVDRAFRGRTLPGAAGEGTDASAPDGAGSARIVAVHHDVLANLFRVELEDGRRRVLDRTVYDAVYEPLVSTFCGNPFVDPEGMDRTLGTFAEAMRAGRVHTGLIKTQLARPGHAFTGPAKASRDIVSFLMEDEEVNARFQRNKEKVHRAMRRTYGGVLPEGANLPVELEGYNLLLLEAHESTHVAFVDLEGAPFTLSTPHYRHDPARALRAPRSADSTEPGFVPAIALPEMVATIADVCETPDRELDLGDLEITPEQYRDVRFWRGLEELTYQVLLVNGVMTLGASETEVARFPWEVRKAFRVAQEIARARGPALSAGPRAA